MGILGVDLDKMNLDDDNFYEDCSDTIIHIRILAWHNKFKNAQHLQKRLAKNYCLYPAIQQDRGIGTCRKMRKKEVDSNFTDKVGKCLNTHFEAKTYVWRLAIVQNLYEFYHLFMYHFLGSNCANTSQLCTTHFRATLVSVSWH